jgi:cysteine synthase A
VLERLQRLPTLVGNSIIMAQRLASEPGIGLGISRGTNFLAARPAHEQPDSDPRVVTVFSDSNMKYLTTDLLHRNPCATAS